MAQHFQRELERLKRRIVSVGSIVEERVRDTKQAINTLDSSLAEKIIMSDYVIDEMEVEVEEECLKIMALYQPVAVDLRFIVAVLKINNDLERIGDEAVNIAKRIQSIASKPQAGISIDYTPMADTAEEMLKLSLDALVNLDLDAALKVLPMDDEVDRLNGEAYEKVKEELSKSPAHPGQLINLMLLARHLERIADHATNIAEEVVYMIEGEIVRHGNL